jgi:hypothetical protein
VNAICPGLVEGARIRRVIAGKAAALGVAEEEMTERLFAGMSIQRFVPPQGIARQIVFLASPHARLISGPEISVCGDTRMLAWRRTGGERGVSVPCADVPPRSGVWISAQTSAISAPSGPAVSWISGDAACAMRSF